MNFPDEDSDVLWGRFDQLAIVSEAARQGTYFKDGQLLLESVVVTCMNNYVLPKISNAEDFSEVVITLRENYRLWNFRLD